MRGIIDYSAFGNNLQSNFGKIHYDQSMFLAQGQGQRLPKMSMVNFYQMQDINKPMIHTNRMTYMDLDRFKQGSFLPSDVPAPSAARKSMFGNSFIADVPITQVQREIQEEDEDVEQP